MSKRQLTGGTGDLKPQIWTIDTTQDTAATEIIESHATPVPRFGGATRTKAAVMEILKVYFYTEANTAINADTTVQATVHTSEPTAGNNFPTNVARPACFAGINLSKQFETSGVGYNVLPLTVDLTDSAGNGFLVATDRIWTVFNTAGLSAVEELTIKLLYRLVSVGITEYVGIVQSQQ